MRRNGIRYEVRAGQLWSVGNMFSSLDIPIRIKRVVGLDATCAVVRQDGSQIREISIRVKTLSSGLRRARLVEEAPGTPSQAGPERGPERVERDRTASEFRRTKAPKGCAVASDRMRLAHLFMRQGYSREVVAQAFGVKPYLLTQWCSRVEEAIRDEALIRRTA